MLQLQTAQYAVLAAFAAVPRFCPLYIRTTPEKLWQALIEPEFTRRFWFGSWQESEWKPGASGD
jgi:hypothetical protein